MPAGTATGFLRVGSQRRSRRQEASREELPALLDGYAGPPAAQERVRERDHQRAGSAGRQPGQERWMAAGARVHADTVSHGHRSKGAGGAPGKDDRGGNDPVAVVGGR